MFEHTVIQVHKTFPSSVMKICHNACTDETLHSTFPSFVLAFSILQKGADRISANSAATCRRFFLFSITPPAVCSLSYRKTSVLFSANSAATYRSFFSLSITPPAVCSISSHKTSMPSRFVLHSLTKLYHMTGTINTKHKISNLRM